MQKTQEQLMRNNSNASIIFICALYLVVLAGADALWVASAYLPRLKWTAVGIAIIGLLWCVIGVILHKRSIRQALAMPTAK